MNNETESQNKRILAFLQQGNAITAIEALNLFQSFRQKYNYLEKMKQANTYTLLFRR